MTAAASATPSIIDALDDPLLFAPHFRDRQSWAPWAVFLRALFGLPVSEADMALFRQCTGRNNAPTQRASEGWLICGRRAGKSRILALIASYLAALLDWKPYLSPGERGLIIIVATDKKQCRVIMQYCRSFLLETEMLKHLYDPKISRDTAEELELTNGLAIEIVTSSYKSVRGRTAIAVLADELAFWADEIGQNPASEVIAALRPSMVTVRGSLLMVASSPYAKRGPLYEAHKRYFGKDSGSILVWQAASKVMNPSLPQEFIDQAYEADPASAASEFGAQFRNDIDSFVAREAVEALIEPGRYELPPRDGRQYVGFVDFSGAAKDAMTLGIAHLENGVAVLDAVRERRPPCSTDSVVEEFAATLKLFHCSSVTGDAYAGEWPRERMRSLGGIEYRLSDLSRSDIYREALPAINSARIELLDNARLVSQICALERRVARSGRDTINHPANGADDLCNSALGALVLASRQVAQRPILCGPIVVISRRPEISDWY